MKKAYYNKHDHKAAAWLRVLIEQGSIADGIVDERDIQNVTPNDLFGFGQCHFFAGIGGWSAALRLAGIQDDQPAWTGSAPCQPFSCAGKGEGQDDERHLWPELFRLIKACQPEIVFGEQVASAEVIASQLEAAFVDAVQAGDYARANRIANRLVKSSSLHFHRKWLDGISADLAGAGYACGATIVGAHSVGAPQRRQRLYWVADARSWVNVGSLSRPNQRTISKANGRHSFPVADAGCQRDERWGGTGNISGAPSDVESEAWQRQRSRDAATNSSATDPVADAQSERFNWSAGMQPAGRRVAEASSGIGALGDTECNGSASRLSESPQRQERNAGEFNDASDSCGAWDSYRIIQTSDGKARRIPQGKSLEPVLQRLVDGFPGSLDNSRVIAQAADGFPLTEGIRGRVHLLKGYGNAIVPQVAAQFIQAYLETLTP